MESKIPGEKIAALGGFKPRSEVIKNYYEADALPLCEPAPAFAQFILRQTHLTNLR